MYVKAMQGPQNVNKVMEYENINGKSACVPISYKT
jgi:hypothetical protein